MLHPAQLTPSTHAQCKLQLVSGTSQSFGWPVCRIRVASRLSILWSWHNTDAHGFRSADQLLAPRLQRHLGLVLLLHLHALTLSS